MKKKPYLPIPEPELAIWLKHYRDALPEAAKTLGLSDAEVAARQALCDKLIAEINKTEAAKRAQQQQTESKNKQKKTTLAYIRRVTRNDKSLEKYDTSVGEALGIIGDEDDINIEKAKPGLTPIKREKGWELSFNLHGVFDGVKIFRQRPNEPKTFLATDTSSPYIDTDPMKNGTQYTAWYLIGDDTGAWNRTL